MSNCKPNTGIYVIENTKNGRRYVGSALRLNARWRDHRRGLENNRHHSRFMQRDWNKCGQDFFKFTILMFCEKESLIRNEQTFIDNLKPEYNSAPVAGSQLGFKMSDESKAKLSAAAKRTKNFTGHKHSEETKARISASRKGKGGGFRSAERLAKISAALKGRVVPKEMRDRIKKKLKGHKQSQEQIKKRMANMPKDHYLKLSQSKNKLNRDQVLRIRGKLAIGDTLINISREFKVSSSVIAHIRDKKTYKEVY